MKDWRAIVGNNVRKHRQKAELTQEQLALEADIDLTYVGGIERGKRNPTVLVLAKIAKALSIAPTALLEEPSTKVR